ncbi:FkbM family methyltransferase [Candidatus Agathobaculum pullicola]|uniref:FkbM family methyltransferase n=1 Tax=Candidatus Agathobaculum pullicola TaxID=2838426 RepID=UPI003F91539E
MLSKMSFEEMKENSLISDVAVEKLKQFPMIVVWGTAGAANYAKQFLECHGLRLSFVTDSSPHYKGEYWKGIPLIDKEKVFEMGKSVIVIIACSYLYKIDRILDKHAIEYVMFDTNLLFCSNFLGIERCDKAKATIINCFEQVKELYHLLQDQKSKDTLQNVLAYRITLERHFLESIYDQNTYFGNDVLTCFDGDTVVDCGAYIGDSMENFWAHGFSCKKYLALEPSPMQYLILKECAKKFKQHNISVLPLAAWEKKEMLSFSQTQGGGSHVGDNGNLLVQADAIDNITKNNHVDLIKMDIEGAEIPALYGARHTIQSAHPIIMASIYHHLTDIWEIPLLLKDMYPEYKIYMRHHSPWGDDTVIYALA